MSVFRVRIPCLSVLVVATSFACSSTPSGVGQDASSPAEVPEPEPTPEPKPEPEPEPEGSEGKVCGARVGNTCAEDEYCAYEPSGICGWADATSVCKTKPEVCTMDYNPVCGCDQKVYSNACAAAAAGTGVLKVGDCENLPGSQEGSASTP